MKREFLQSLTVGQQPLPKEVVDAILDENSRDIGAVKQAYSDYDQLKAGFTADGKTAEEWKQAHDQAVQTHQAQLEQLTFRHSLDASITAAGGRSTKAITALLDVTALQKSEDQTAAIKAALEELKKECGYLFQPEQVPPPYAAGTGTAGSTGRQEYHNSLAGALREKFERK